MKEHEFRDEESIDLHSTKEDVRNTTHNRKLHLTFLEWCNGGFQSARACIKQVSPRCMHILNQHIYHCCSVSKIFRKDI